VLTASFTLVALLHIAACKFFKPLLNDLNNPMILLGVLEMMKYCLNDKEQAHCPV
jgi:hypothetical protein